VSAWVPLTLMQDMALGWIGFFLSRRFMVAPDACGWYGQPISPAEQARAPEGTSLLQKLGLGSNLPGVPRILAGSLQGSRDAVGDPRRPKSGPGAATVAVATGPCGSRSSFCRGCLIFSSSRSIGWKRPLVFWMPAVAFGLG